MRILAVLIFAVGFLFAKPGDGINAILNEYLKNGAVGIEKLLDDEIATENFWRDRLEGKSVDYGYYEKMKFILLSNKSKPDLRLVLVEDGGFKEVVGRGAYVGQKSGMKEKEGDLRTPIGAYNLVEKKTKLDDYYGPLALVTSYPNLYDSLQSRGGSGIWIHGVPSNGERPQNTRGCIAVENDYMKALGEVVALDSSVLIVSDNEIEPLQKEDIIKIFAQIYDWRNTWKYSDIKQYLTYYDKEQFKRFDGKGFEEFKRMKETIFARNERKTIVFNDINIIPYPNPEGKKMFRVTFHQDYRSDNYKFVGDKELYIELRDGKMKILAER